MKKQAQKAMKTKKTSATKSTEAVWHVRAQALPLALFHTTIGPIIGRVEKADEPGAGSFNIRLWAPAAIRMGFQPGQPGAMVAPYWVTFQPIALIETYLDLSAETPFGRSPVPQVLVPAYEDYFAKVAAGDYSYARSTAHVEQAMPHEAPIATEPQAPVETTKVPWHAESDPHTWLTRKVYALDENEVIERDDPRRVLVKRVFYGWAYDTTAEKVADNFGLDVIDVRHVFDVIEGLSDEDKEGAKVVLGTRNTFPGTPQILTDEIDVS